MKRKANFLAFLLVLFFLASSFLLIPPREKSRQETGRYYIDTVINNVKIGSLAGNRNLSFGVRNITEEALMDLEYDIAGEKKNATHHISIEIIYFDIEQVKSNLSVFHKDANITIIRLRGKLEKDGKVIKNVFAEEKSSEISMSSFLISDGGGFNQQSASNALKKACISLIQKMLVTSEEKNKNRK